MKDRFLELLKYVSFIKEDHVKIHRYLSGLPSFISDKIQYDDHKKLEETIRRAKFLYDKHKGRKLSKNLRKRRRKKIWNRGKGGLSHLYSEIILKDIQLLENPE
jgi:hypothetical protein